MKQNLIKKSVLLITILLLLGTSIDITASKLQNNFIYQKSQKTREYGYWMQTTNEDFNNGTKYNINVSKDSFFLKEKIAVINQTVLGPESFESIWPPSGWFVTGGWNK